MKGEDCLVRIAAARPGADPGGPPELERRSVIARLQAGHIIAGEHELHFITGVGATLDLAGSTYRIAAEAPYRSMRVTIPESGPVTLRCTSGAINLDRMELVR